MVENVGLHGGAERHDFVGIQLDVRLAIEKLLHRAADQRRARGAADEHDFVQVRRLEMSVRKRLFDRAHGAFDDRADPFLERSPRKSRSVNGAVWKRKTQNSFFIL